VTLHSLKKRKEKKKREGGLKWGSREIPQIELNRDGMG
jgi:hypothetical protein